MFLVSAASFTMWLLASIIDFMNFFRLVPVLIDVLAVHVDEHDVVEADLLVVDQDVGSGDGERRARQPRLPVRESDDVAPLDGSSHFRRFNVYHALVVRVVVELVVIENSLPQGFRSGADRNADLLALQIFDLLDLVRRHDAVPSVESDDLRHGADVVVDQMVVDAGKRCRMDAFDW